MLAIDQKGEKKYPFLFNPLKIGNLIVPNRIFFPPCDFNWANQDGSVSAKLHDFCVSLAENGCGIVYTGVATVAPDPIRNEYCLGIYAKRHVETNRKLCKEIEARGAIPAIQLNNFGREPVAAFTRKPILASNLSYRTTAPDDPNYQKKEMVLEDIRRVKNDFIKSAVLAAEAGYKIIQIQAAHGYLLCGFLSTYTNKRTDAFGGSVENRSRIAIEIIEAIRKNLGDRIVIDIRLSVDEFVNGGLAPGDYAKIAPLLEKAGVQMMNVAGSNFESSVDIFPVKSEPEARYAYLAEALKKYTLLPVGHAAFIGSLAKGEELVKEKKIDLAGFGRMQFADQSFIKKSVSGKKINQCLWCGGCLKDSRDPKLFSVYCTVNKKYKRPKTSQHVSA